MLFSSPVKNEAKVIIFVTCNGLSDAKKSWINSKIHKPLSKIENWSRAKGDSNWIHAVFVYSEYLSIANHFSLYLI